MAILALISADGVTKEVYETLRKEVNWEKNHPAGGMFHVAGFRGSGIQVVDVWASEQDWNNFVNTRLLPVLKRMNIPAPKAEIIPAHNINVFPAIERFRVAEA
jgi:hypothetical protein